ncbi:hypothetical protein DRE_05198 [Drechslerella stenobrocha 248]|uniref:Uncharacterized protein n=1 Tax=Drechslerella stenobrocha 248 TaxID=1043628 RepID=W7HZJ5_9PEZI|nr:hypothetical protein DRE_05198 [Drechslerella stenobrocha 248]
MMIRQRNIGADHAPTLTPLATPTLSSSPIQTAGGAEANRVAHVTSAVIGCILGAALAGAIFAIGLALYRFNRRQQLRKQLLARITTQIALEHANDEIPISEDTRRTLIAERFTIVAERYWRQQRRLHARGGRRPARRRDDLRDMSGDLYRNQTRGPQQVREPDVAYLRFGGADYVPIYATMFPGWGDRGRRREALGQ